jgi:hypothetical protein
MGILEKLFLEHILINLFTDALTEQLDSVIIENKVEYVEMIYLLYLYRVEFEAKDNLIYD